MTTKKHINYLLRLHKEHKMIKETWDEYNVYFWLISGATFIGIYLKLPGLIVYIIALASLRIGGTLRHHVGKHIKKHSNYKSKKNII